MSRRPFRKSEAVERFFPRAGDVSHMQHIRLAPPELPVSYFFPPPLVKYPFAVTEVETHSVGDRGVQLRNPEFAHAHAGVRQGDRNESKRKRNTLSALKKVRDG